MAAKGGDELGALLTQVRLLKYSPCQEQPFAIATIHSLPPFERSRQIGGGCLCLQGSRTLARLYGLIRPPHLCRGFPAMHE